MKLSCLPVSIFPELSNGKMSLKEWITYAAECGYDGYDLSMSFIHSHAATYVAELGDVIKTGAIPPVMATTYPDFTHPDKTQRERELLYLMRDIALCSELCIPYLRVLAGQAHPETNIDDGIRWAVQNIRLSAEIADRFGVKLLYEDHAKPGAWQYVDMTFPPELFLRVADGIWDTSVGINFDIANITAFGEDPVPVLKKVLPKVETIHVTDMKEKGKFSPVLIGTGVAPIKETFRVLKDAGWDKWLCIEEASYQGLAGIKEAAANTRKLWDEA